MLTFPVLKSGICGEENSSFANSIIVGKITKHETLN
jgi:hypothetical protein